MSVLLKKRMRKAVARVRKALGMAPYRLYQHRIVEIKPEYEACTTFILEPETAADKLKFKPGQYAHVAAPDIEMSKPYVRHMSIASLPGEQTMFSMDLSSNSPYKQQYKNAKAGSRVTVFKLAGQFTLKGLKASDKIVFIAGGIGITPMRSLILELERRKNLGKAVPSSQLIHVGRQHLYRSELEKLTECQFIGRDEVPQTFDGLVTGDGPKTHYFVCGGHDFIVAMVDRLRQGGVQEKRIRTEDFTH